CGAGISIPPPTSLPSGNELRDLCIEHLLLDEQNRLWIRQVLSDPVFQAMLPESALQEVGYSIAKNVDSFFSAYLAQIPPNELHRSLATSFGEIFTTNFDLCLEHSGAPQVYHLHGTVKEPDSLQNRLWRLGQTSTAELALLKQAVDRGPIFVTGYSLRD